MDTKSSNILFQSSYFIFSSGSQSAVDLRLINLVGSLIFEGGVKPLTVVENQDIFKDHFLGFLDGLEVQLVQPFHLHFAPKRFHRCIVPAVSLAGDVATLAMRLFPSPIGILQRTDRQILAHSCRHGQPDVVVPKEVVDGCYIKLPFIGTDIGDVRNQLFIRPLSLEIAVQEVLCDGKIVVGIRGRLVFLHRFGVQIVFLHEPFNLFVFDGNILVCLSSLEGYEYLRGSVHAVGFLVNRDDRLKQHLVFPFFVWIPFSLSTCKIRWGNLEDLTHLHDLKPFSISLNKQESLYSF